MKIKFANMITARKYQKDFKKRYGYRPSLFEVHNNRGKELFVIKPKGLIKIK